MNIIKTEINDLLIIEPNVFGDDRGFFMESFRADKLKEFGVKEDFIQDNHSKSSKGVLRGLHYQVDPKAQGKLVRVTQGEVYDVAVDLRKDSETYLQWKGIILNEDNKKMFYVPPGFAHGFYVMSETAEFLYKCTNYYSPEHEGGIMWNDPTLNIDWPEGEKKLSQKDEENQVINDFKSPF